MQIFPGNFINFPSSHLSAHLFPSTSKIKFPDEHELRQLLPFLIMHTLYALVGVIANISVCDIIVKVLISSAVLNTTKLLCKSIIP